MSAIKNIILLDVITLVEDVFLTAPHGEIAKELAMGNRKRLPNLSGNTVLIVDTKTVMF